MHTIFVSQLFLYPVKSLGGISVESLDLTESGPNFDRQWMVVDRNGKFLTQRILPRMCLIETQLHHGVLTLEHPKHSPIVVPQGGGREIDVTVWRDTVRAQDCGDQVANWLSKELGKECRMVFMPKGQARNSPAGDFDFTSQLGFADAYPLLLASESSLAHFNSYLENAITMDRFRPNIVIRGSAAFAEDQWQKIHIGEQPYVLASPCTRCAVPSIDPLTGDKQNEVLEALNQHRRFGTETHFGQNVVYPQATTLQVGDRVEIAA